MAGSVNKVILVGNLGKDPEIRRTQDGRPIANLSVATSETWRDKSTGERKEKTEWHRVVIFNEGLCKVVEQYLKKGAKVYIEGALQTRKWTDQSGVEKYSTEVVLQGFNSTLTMLDGRSGGGGGGSFGSDESAAISAPAARSAPRRAVQWPRRRRPQQRHGRRHSVLRAADLPFRHGVLRPAHRRRHEIRSESEAFTSGASAMSLAPLLDAARTIPLHAFAAMAAFALGLVQFAAPKGTLPHRTVGWIWVLLMLAVAISSFWIHQIRLVGPFSPIHLLSIFTLVMLPLAVLAGAPASVSRHSEGHDLDLLLARSCRRAVHASCPDGSCTRWFSASRPMRKQRFGGWFPGPGMPAPGGAEGAAADPVSL